ncbi:hypothetical protein PF003_g37605 [Phytophthora fragariae]|nr:hypothetical protein PF003_g37605 [Phytophthora fragariae]
MVPSEWYQAPPSVGLLQKMARDFNISRLLRLREAFPFYVGMLGSGVSAQERVGARAKWRWCHTQGRRTRQEAKVSEEGMVSCLAPWFPTS